MHRLPLVPTVPEIQQAGITPLKVGEKHQPIHAARFGLAPRVGDRPGGPFGKYMTPRIIFRHGDHPIESDRDILAPQAQANAITSDELSTVDN
jgi:hypothetical protein